MPVIVLEASDLTSPLSLVRMLALLSGCLTFSLVASLVPSELTSDTHQPSFRILCMFTWCLFFILTFLIHVVNIIQFHSLVPISWKNLTVTVAALATLMTFSATVTFPWAVMGHEGVWPRPIAAVLASCLTFLAYATEAYLIRTQTQNQKGYMASVPGLLKVLQLWGGCEMIVLVVEQVCGALVKGAGVGLAAVCWQLWVSGVVYALCLLMSMGTVMVVLGDCAGRCPLPFDRLLASFSLTGVLLYVVATVLCFTRVLELQNSGQDFTDRKTGPTLVVMEAVMTSITLLAYTVDLAFSIKLLRDRSHA
ncbi:myeloid-associated differentiation marker homolog [Salvelinus alpinus]|uniref:myeloid-associated differentiation marker homolog n=1 Tax=Salvelinus sp. IW2-2015 TaxID=2691554 RepID=UPI000CEA9F1F|nr:myeloid-associated differentiation marker homolog [Salvelinus alpinus]